MSDIVTLRVHRDDAAFIARILKWGEQGMCVFAQDRLTDWENAKDEAALATRTKAFNDALNDARRAQHMVPSLCAVLTGAVTRTSV